MDKPRRSLLFTPANRPGSFEKAMKSGADIVCLDLEDAIPIDQKASARQTAFAFLNEPAIANTTRAVRINSLSSATGLQDLASLAGSVQSNELVMLPKVMEAAELRLVDSVLREADSKIELAALIETLDGLENVSEIAKATPRLKLMVFGAVDFSAELGTPNSYEALHYARSKIVHAAKRADLDVMDAPELNFRDLNLIENHAERARTLGFTGKAAIHPMGLQTINTVFTPSQEDIEQAYRVIAAFDASSNGLAVLDGRLVEEPVVKAMRRRLAIARTCGSIEMDRDE